MATQPAPDQLPRTFVLPRELSRSRPRDVRLTAGGWALLGLAVSLFAAAVGAGIGLSIAADRQARQQRVFVDEGIDTRGEVIRLWRASDENKSRWVSYRYVIEGRAYEGRTKIGSSTWTALRVGGTLPVRYLRSDLGRSWGAGVEPRAMPRWLPFVVAGALAIIGWFCIAMIRGQLRLLTDGRAAPAIVIRHTMHRTQHGRKQYSMAYTFRLMSGATAEGKAGASSTPAAVAVGSVICVVYDPDLPSRSTPYPLPLVRPARV
jgi:hypothetical protein